VSNQSNGFEFGTSQTKEKLKAKLGYEWRTIYRSLARSDTENQGVVLISAFEKACEKACVTLAK